jgi:hypothetical protein
MHEKQITNNGTIRFIPFFCLPLKMDLSPVCNNTAMMCHLNKVQGTRDKGQAMMAIYFRLAGIVLVLLLVLGELHLHYIKV